MVGSHPGGSFFARENRRYCAPLPIIAIALQAAPAGAWSGQKADKVEPGLIAPAPMDEDIRQLMDDWEPVPQDGLPFNNPGIEFPLDDMWLVGSALYYQKGRATFGIDVDGEQSALTRVSKENEIMGTVSYPLNEQMRVLSYGYTGRSHGSANIGGGVQIVYRFGG